MNLLDARSRTTIPGALRRVAVIALALGALAGSPARGSSDGELDTVSVDELKRIYLACGRAAESGRLETAGIMQCSIVYEALKRRAFGGDFARLLAWSRAQTSARSTGQ